MRRVSIDFATLIGLSVSFALLGICIYISGSFRSFMDLGAFLLVIIGTFFVTMTCFSFKDIVAAQRLLIQTIFTKVEEPSYAAYRAIQIAEIAKREGILSLQGKEVMAAHNRFFAKGLQMLVDNFKSDDIQYTLQQALEASSERHKRSAAVLRKSAEVAPALGLIGTLIGLVQMLGQLNDPKAIGPAMAIALLTTLYGAVMAYMVFTPLASKLEHNSQKEMIVSSIYKEALGSIARKENPRQLEIHINTTLPKDQRVRYYEQA
ncbi:MAG: MotA/TolQ/ExbB proton channel family protein [Alphaproteobacteria bacterium]|nr:MotA/TolQ/ExbB proton channel family protein [Alphaproteobacteria bacterium]